MRGLPTSWMMKERQRVVVLQERQGDGVAATQKGEIAE